MAQEDSPQRTHVADAVDTHNFAQWESEVIVVHQGVGI